MDSRARGSKRRREATGSSAGIQRNDRSSVACSRGVGRTQCPDNCPRKLRPGWGAFWGSHQASAPPFLSAPGRKMSLKLKKTLGTDSSSVRPPKLGEGFETGRGGTRLTPPPSRTPGARPQFMQPALVEERRNQRPLIPRKKVPRAPAKRPPLTCSSHVTRNRAHHVTGAAPPSRRLGQSRPSRGGALGPPLANRQLDLRTCAQTVPPTSVKPRPGRWRGAGRGGKQGKNAAAAARRHVTTPVLSRGAASGAARERRPIAGPPP